MEISELHERLTRVEKSLRATRLVLIAVIACAAIAIVAAFDDPPATTEIVDEVRTRRLVVVDDEGVQRIMIGQDAPDTQRRSRSAAIWVYDKHGNERGGWGTFEDDSVVLALDAPAGVGSPMRDRLGLAVFPNGAAAVSLINNTTGVPVRLISEADGTGGVDFYTYDLENRKGFRKRLSFDGEEEIVEFSLGGGE